MGNHLSIIAMAQDSQMLSLELNLLPLLSSLVLLSWGLTSQTKRSVYCGKILSLTKIPYLLMLSGTERPDD